ncbi:522_t:CDS:2, partial [Entrophospora sp. SA101]
MQEHLANRCPNVPVDVKQVFLEIILHKHQDDNFFDATDSLTTSNSSNKNHSHQGNHYLKEAIQRFEISGGGLKTYIKTRWSSAWDCLNSVKRLENGLKWIVSENPTVITNGDVLSLLQQCNFFSDVEILCEVLKPIKEAVVSMQTNHANLADCFIHMCHIGVAIKKLSSENNPELKIYCYKV